MTTSNFKVLFSICISTLVHIFLVMNFFYDETKNQQVYVLNLSSYKPIQFEEPKEVPKEIKKKTDIEKPKIKEKKIDKVEKKIDKVEKKKDKIFIQPVKKPAKLKKIEDAKVEEQQIEEVFKAERQVKRVIKQSSRLQNDKNKILVDKILSEYLKKISIEINKIANQSYPRQSIKRREQGSIRIIITLNENGKILELFFENKKPKRLYKATKNIIESFTFPKPSKEILTANNTLRIKIPVNYILK